MKWLLSLILFAVAIPSSVAVQKLYQSGKIVSIEEKAHTRILYYQVNTPITQDDPYYEVTVQLPGMVYVGEYTPRHSDDTLPDDWTAEAEIQARVDKHHLFVKRPSGTELDLIVVKHTPAGPPKTTPEATPPKN